MTHRTAAGRIREGAGIAWVFLWAGGVAALLVADEARRGAGRWLAATGRATWSGLRRRPEHGTVLWFALLAAVAERWAR